MRKEIVRVETKQEAMDACPWAAVVIEVEGGWMCFESVDDARTWENQR